MHRIAMIMAASAAMIVAGAGIASAQDAPDSVDAPSATSTAPPPRGLALLDQVQSLRDQMQQMQGQIEILQHKLQLLEQADKDHYADLDARLGKLEHAQPPASAPTASAPTATAPVASAAPAADPAAVQADYDAAFKALRAGNYVDSARGFRAFIDKYPQSPLLANAYYWLGGSYSITQNFKPALAAYETLLRKYPDSAKAPDAQLRVAECQISLKDYHAARASLKAVIKAHPGTPLAKRARERLDQLPASAAAR